MINELKDYINESIDIHFGMGDDKREKQLHRCFAGELRIICDKLEELEPKFETLTDKEEMAKYFWNNILLMTSQIHHDKDLREKKIIATMETSDEDFELEITVRRKNDNTIRLRRD